GCCAGGCTRTAPRARPSPSRRSRPPSPSRRWAATCAGSRPGWTRASRTTAGSCWPPRTGRRTAGSTTRAGSRRSTAPTPTVSRTTWSGTRRPGSSDPGARAGRGVRGGGAGEPPPPRTARGVAHGRSGAGRVPRPPEDEELASPYTARGEPAVGLRRGGRGEQGRSADREQPRTGECGEFGEGGGLVRVGHDVDLVAHDAAGHLQRPGPAGHHGAAVADGVQHRFAQHGGV